MESEGDNIASSESEYLDSESDFSDELEENEELGARPYLFEPLVSDQDGDDNNDDVPGFEEEVDRDGRLGNNNWCSCSGGCAAMPALRESVCCKEIERIVDKMDEEADVNCITEHPGFEAVCLNKYVLETAYYQYRQQYGDQARADATVNQKCRHVAYRQLVRWCWGFLGRQVRVPLPSCAVTRIRAAFPSDEYRGFHEA